MHVLVDIPDTGWSTRKMWGNLLPYVMREPGIDLEVALGDGLECQRLNNLLRNDRVSCMRRFPWPDFRPARVRWRMEDILFIGHRWLHGFETFHSSTVRTPTFGKWKKCITVLDTIRELYPDEFGPANHSILRMRKRAVERCDGILTISKYSKNCIVSIFNVNPEKVFVSYLAVNQHKVPVQSTWALPSNPFVLYVGRRSGYKNFSVLTHAMASANCLRKLTIVAIGGGALTDAEENQFRKLGILQQIKVFDDVSEELLTNSYKKAIALVYPSKMEGFGLPPIEAQAAGCPVIASNAGPIPEVVGSGGVFFDPEDYSTLASLIEYVSKRDVRDQLIKAGFANLSRFCWEESAQSIIQMYRA